MSLCLLENLVAFLMPDKAEQALLDIMHNWVVDIPGMPPFTAENFLNNRDVLICDFKKIVDIQISKWLK